MKEQILKLRAEGKTYTEIKDTLKCSKGTISFHCGEGQKEKARLRNKRIKNNSDSNIQTELIECLFCSKKFKNNKKRTRKFCGILCANSIRRRQITEEEKQKIAERKYYNLKFKDFVGADRSNKIKEDKILNTDFHKLGFDNKRLKVKLEQQNKCKKCNLDSWMGEQLTLELEHKDGNNKNNDRDNLEALCPNCHSLTKTWRGRNRGDLLRTTKLTSQDYINAYKKSNGNVHKALLILKLTPKGGNYKSMYKHLDSADIKYKKRSKRYIPE